MELTAAEQKTVKNLRLKTDLKLLESLPLSDERKRVLFDRLVAEVKAEKAARQREYHAAHREERNARRREYHAAHREERNAYSREYFATEREKCNTEIHQFFGGISAISGGWGNTNFHHVVPYTKEKPLTTPPFCPVEAAKTIPVKDKEHIALHIALAKHLFETRGLVCGVPPQNYGRKECDPWPEGFDYVGWTRNYILQERAKLDNPSTVPLDFFEALRQG